MPKKDLPAGKSGYQPTRIELELDVNINATPEELAQAVVGNHPMWMNHPRAIADETPEDAEAE